MDKKVVAVFLVGMLAVALGGFVLYQFVFVHTTTQDIPQQIGTMSLDVYLNFVDGSSSHLTSQGVVSDYNSLVYSGKEVQSVRIVVDASLNKSIVVQSTSLTLTIGVNPSTGGDTITVASPTSTTLPFTYVINANQLQAGQVVVYPTLTVTANSPACDSNGGIGCTVIVVAKYVGGIQPVSFTLTSQSAIVPLPDCASLIPPSNLHMTAIPVGSTIPSATGGSTTAGSSLLPNWVWYFAAGAVNAPVIASWGGYYVSNYNGQSGWVMIPPYSVAVACHS